MNFLTDLVKKALGADTQSAQGQTEKLVSALISLIEDDRVGGFEGLIDKFRRSGLEDVVSSWVSKGENKPISPEQIVKALGPEQVATLSREAGLPPEQGASALSSLLPSVVDRLTPDGLIPEKKTLLTLDAGILAGVGAALAVKAAHTAFGRKEAVAEEAAAPAAAGAPPPQAAEPAAAGGTTYTVVAGDTLSKIAKRFYGDANDWPRIFEANKDKIDNPDRIFPGQQLWIP